MPDITTVSVDKAVSEISDVAKKIASSALSGSDIINLPAAFAAKAYGDTISKFVNPIKNIITASDNIVNDVQRAATKINSESKDLVNSFTNTACTAVDKVAFATSSTKKLIEGISLPGVGEIFDATGLTTKQIEKLVTGGTDTLKSSLDVAKAVKNTIDHAVAAGGAAVQAVQKTISSVVTPIVSPIVDIAKTAEMITNPNNVKYYVQKNLDFLPSSLSSAIGSAAAQSVAGINKNVSSITGQILGVSNVMDHLEILSGYGTSSFANISGSAGKYIPGYSSYTESGTAFTGLANTVQKLCNGNATISEYSEFGTNKDIFDLLIMECLKTQAGGLLEALLNCAGPTYTDSRSLSIMSNMLDMVVRNGDAYSTNVLLKSTAGSGIVQDKQMTAKTLIANTVYTDQTAKDIGEILDALDISPRSLVTTPASGIDAIDAESVTFLSASSTGFVDSVMSEDERNTAYVLFHAYAA